MKKILIILLLISPFSFADWGDVYYCQMTANSVTTIECERTDYKLEKFTFKLDKTKNAMVFGKGGLFKEYKTWVDDYGSNPSKEVWSAKDSIGMLYFEEGKFLFVSGDWKESTTVSADCEKF